MTGAAWCDVAAWRRDRRSQRWSGGSPGRSKVQTSCSRLARSFPPTGRKRRGRSAVAPTRPCSSRQRRVSWSDSRCWRSSASRSRGCSTRSRTSRSGYRRWRRRSVWPSRRCACGGWRVGPRRRRATSTWPPSTTRATTRCRCGRCSGASWPASPRSATAVLSASKARPSTPARSSARRRSDASPASSPARTRSSSSSPGRPRAWRPSSRRRPRACCSPSRCPTGPTSPAATCCRRWWPPPPATWRSPPSTGRRPSCRSTG